MAQSYEYMNSILSQTWQTVLWLEFQRTFVQDHILHICAAADIIHLNVT